MGLTEPTNRNWAGEDKNYVTYREFLLYLEEYQRTMLLEFKEKTEKTVAYDKGDSVIVQSKTKANCSKNCSCETVSAGIIYLFELLIIVNYFNLI